MFLVLTTEQTNIIQIKQTTFKKWYYLFDILACFLAFYLLYAITIK